MQKINSLDIVFDNILGSDKEILMKNLRTVSFRKDLSFVKLTLWTLTQQPSALKHESN